MTSAPKSKRVIITNQEQLDNFIEELKDLSRWGGIHQNRPYDKGKFFIDIEQRAEWFYSEEAHEKTLKAEKRFNDSQF